MTEAYRHPLPLIAELGITLGDTNLNQRPGLYHLKVDEQWELWLNPHREEIGERDIKVPPFACYVEYNGWPAGVFNAADVTFAAGDCANIETFMDALERRIAAEKGER